MNNLKNAAIIIISVTHRQKRSPVIFKQVPPLAHRSQLSTASPLNGGAGVWEGGAAVVLTVGGGCGEEEEEEEDNAPAVNVDVLVWPLPLFMDGIPLLLVVVSSRRTLEVSIRSGFRCDIDRKESFSVV